LRGRYAAGPSGCAAGNRRDLMLCLRSMRTLWQARHHTPADEIAYRTCCRRTSRGAGRPAPAGRLRVPAFDGGGSSLVREECGHRVLRLIQSAGEPSQADGEVEPPTPSLRALPLGSLRFPGILSPQMQRWRAAFLRPAEAERADQCPRTPQPGPRRVLHAEWRISPARSRRPLRSRGQAHEQVVGAAFGTDSAAAACDLPGVSPGIAWGLRPRVRHPWPSSVPQR
jgi:hypothetical protein